MGLTISRGIFFSLLMVLYLLLAMPLLAETMQTSPANWLTQEERDYIRNNSPFTICEQHDIYPLSGVQNSHLIGMRGDYIEEIVKRTGLKLKVIGSSSRDELIQKVNNKECDMIGSLGSNQKIFPTVINTDTVMTFPYGVMGDLQSFNIAPYNDLSGHTFIVRFENIKKTILKAYPNLKIDVINDIDTAISKVGGKVHFVALKPVTERVIQRYGFKNYKLNGVLDQAKQKSTMGVHEDHPMLLSIINKTIKQIEPVFLNRILDKYSIKEFKIVHSYAWLWYVVGGLLVLLIGIQFKYIQTRKKAEQSLKISEKHLKDLIHLTPVGLALCTIDGKLVNINSAFADIIGYSIDETLELSYWDITPRKYERQEQEQLKILETAGHYGPYEKEYQHKDGHLVPVRLKGMMITIQNQKCIWSSVEDITTMKEKDRLKEKLRQAQKMEAIGTLAGGVAHNFNNNLAVILGNIELAALQITDPEKACSFLETAKMAVTRSRDLIRQIMIYSRQETFEKNSFKASDLFSETLEFLNSTVPATVTIKSSIDKDAEELAIYGDKVQIQQSLLNLCSNAVHAMSQRGVLEIELNSFEVEFQDVSTQYQAKPGSYVCFRVTDNGCGIDDDRIEKIFDPFFTTKEVGQGTGMGLATLRGTINSHHGFIEVQSEIGEGTTFQIYIPAARATQKNIKSNQPLLHGNNENILFIDDDKEVADVAKELLKIMGYQVTVATQAKEAFELFMEKPESFDLVISDQVMPQMTGKELTQKIKKIRADIPIIICTGYDTQISEEELSLLGVSAFCQKPLEANELAIKIRESLTN